ncbi:hypothetical protein N0V90_003492 [Kalmusia sp. IMI 367209]|nr:hypothetical protein N0V90_003492 [Kalmusia sp. IMI 367209]
MSKLIGAAVKGISTGIGLAGEKYYDHKERKAALSEQGRSSSSTEEAVQELGVAAGEESANDERIWALDEAAGAPPAYEALDPNANSDDVIAQMAHDVSAAKTQQAQLHAGEIAHLPHPVIIPQRRPGSKARGWTRAYALDLEPLGIDQDTFLRFLETWDKVAQGSPWFKAVQLSAGIVGMAIPGPIVMGVTTAVSIAAGAASELEGRYKANAFLDKMNKEVFMPSGLYAMVIVCKQEASANNDIQLSVETMNLENAKNVSKWGLPDSDTASKSKFSRPIRIASGKANVDDMPLEIAPLIYPGLDDMVRRPDLNRNESFKERIMRNKDFVADYFDRRAQADFKGNNPDAALTKASSDMPEFKTRFADPNHACNNGHLVSLVTGGKFVAQGRGLGLRDRSGGFGGGRQGGGLLGGRQGLLGGRAREGLLAGRRGLRGGYYEDDDYEDSGRRSPGGRLGSLLQDRRVNRGPQLREVGEDGKLKPREKQAATQPRGPIGFALKSVKKVLKSDVMYLTIVNLPTEEEMEQARMALGMDKKGWQEIIEGMRRR